MPLTLFTKAINRLTELSGLYLIGFNCEIRYVTDNMESYSEWILKTFYVAVYIVHIGVIMRKI